MREQARALTGWTADWLDDVGLRQLQLRPEAPRHGPEDDLRPDRGLRLDRLVPAVREALRPQDLLRRASSGATSSRCRRRRRRARRSSGSTSKRGYAVRPVVEAILMHPAFYRGPAMVKPPIVYIAGLLRARRRGIESDWSWMADMAGQRLFRPPNVSGWDDARWLDTSTFRGRWTAANEVAGYDVIDDEASYSATETPKAAVRKAVRFWGNPPLSRQTIQDPGALRGRGRGGRHRRLAAGHVPAPAPERAADAGRHLSRDADVLRRPRMGCNHCEEFSRSHLCAERRPRPGAGCRRSSRGCRRPRAPGSTGARSCSARAPRCSPSTGPRS